MKNIGTVIAVLIAVAACSLAFRYSQTAEKASGKLNDERYQRLTAEEDLNIAQEKVNSLNSELARAKKKIKGIELQLEQLSDINEDFKARLDKAAKIKDNLEAKIKEIQQLSLGEAPEAVTNTVSDTIAVTGGL